MTDGVTHDPDRIALLCDFDDPAAQLIAASLRPAEVVPVETVPDGGFEHLVILSQTLFLVHADKLADLNARISLIVRRRTGVMSYEEWAEQIALTQNSLELLAGELGDTEVALYGLSDLAVSHVDAAGLNPIALWPQSAEVLARPAQAEVDAARAVVTIKGSGAPSLKADAINWAALARRAQLQTTSEAAEDFQDIVAIANHLPLVEEDAAAPTYIIVVPNGVGLGHLTRMLAVARRLGERARLIFWCYSRAALIIKQAGFAVIARQTAHHLGIDGDAWRQWETLEFAHLLRHSGATRVIFDGSTVDAFITRAMREPGLDQVSLVWIRRAMWQEGSNANVIEASQFCDLIIEPGDLAAKADRGPTTYFVPEHRGFSKLVKVDPVTLLSPEDMRTRREARKHLGLKRGTYCLVNLGADHFVDRTVLSTQIAELAQANRVTLVWAQSPLAEVPVDAKLPGEVLRQFPLARDFAAFDGIISAAGYNSFQELMMMYEGPVLFAPTVHARLDDQPARAGYAVSQGWAEALDTGQNGAAQYQTLSDFIRGLGGRSTPSARPEFQSGVALICDVITGSSASGGPGDG